MIRAAPPLTVRGGARQGICCIKTSPQYVHVCVCVGSYMCDSRFVINARVHSTVWAVVSFRTQILFFHSNSNTVGKKQHVMRVIHTI